jgi:tetratricopeptide (TPR) repeat protein
MNRAAALRDLGEVQQAREELGLLVGLNDEDTIPAVARGRARYHLALCQWRLGDREAALREAEQSLKAYGEEPELAPLKQQTEQLLADLKDNKALPPLAKVDTTAALENARVRFRAAADLATLPLNRSVLPLLDQLLGPAPSTEEVFVTLDRQYREAGKPGVWFLPLTEPIAPHLDETPGPGGAAEAGMKTRFRRGVCLAAFSNSGRFMTTAMSPATTRSAPRACIS